MKPPHLVELVRFSHIDLTYPSSPPVLSQSTYSFHIGSFTFLTGISGAGKTSVLRLIYRDLRPTGGLLKVFGKDVSKITRQELPSFRQKIGIVFQDCRLFPHLNVLDNVALALQITGTDLVNARKYAKELLEWVGLQDHLNDFPLTLSDGQKQRVAIARAVIGRPLLLLADEPTGNLDYESGYRLIRLFEELNKIGTTVIIATHNRTLVSDFQYPELEIIQGEMVLRDARKEYAHAASW